MAENIRYSNLQDKSIFPVTTALLGVDKLMKNFNTLGLVLIALLAANKVAMADEQYPAANFEPKVTFIDENAAKASDSGGDEKYPAANFQPKVTFIDESAVGGTQVWQASVIDEKYPAANFQAKVIYSDESAVSAASDQADPKYPAAYFKPKVIYP